MSSLITTREAGDGAGSTGRAAAAAASRDRPARIRRQEPDAWMGNFMGVESDPSGAGSRAIGRPADTFGVYRGKR